MERKIWSSEELLVALDLYCRIPYGLIHTRNHEIQTIAERLGRTPGALAMKLSNFAAFDPVHQTRGIKGLRNGAKADEVLMKEFLLNPEEKIRAASQAFSALGIEAEEKFNPTIASPNGGDADLRIPVGPTEQTRTVQVRVTQRFFRNAVLSSYDFKCAFCSLGIPELLNASHIIPWNIDESQRSNPRNGLSLCAIHDRAFDRGLVGIDESSRILLSPQMKKQPDNEIFEAAFVKIEGNLFTMPRRFAPAHDALAYHRKHIFQI